jgi:hypothetical protein
VRAALAAVLLALAFAFPATALRADEAPFAVEVESRPILHFRRGSGETRFGALEFAGGFEMRAPAPAFGQLSALRFLTPGGDFVGVADHGYWFFGRIRRNEAGVPQGVEGFRIQAMVDGNGRAIDDKRLADAEGLEVAGGVATVSFERAARLTEYRLGPDGAGRPLRDLDFVIPRHELRFNRGIETVARAPQGGPRIVVAERSIDANGDIFAAIVDGPGKGVFKVRRSDDFDVTDGAFLPGGDLILLPAARQRRHAPAPHRGRYDPPRRAGRWRGADRSRPFLAYRQHGRAGRVATRRRRDDAVDPLRRQSVVPAKNDLSGIRRERIANSE